MRYSLTKEWMKITETQGLAENVSSAARIEVSRSQDNGGLILDPSEQLYYNGDLYARKHAGGGAAILAVFAQSNSVDVNVGYGSLDTVTPEDVNSLFGSECMFPTHSQVNRPTVLEEHDDDNHIE